MNLFDAHNHLQDEWLQPHRPDMWRRLAEIGLKGAVVNGTTESDWAEVAQLAMEHPWIIPSYGVHPWFIAQRSDDWERNLENQLVSGGVIGEIGLDRWKQPFDFADQQRVFRRQLQMAAEWKRPATIHCLQAWGALLDILRRETLPPGGFLLHAYGGPREMIPEFVDLGAYFSFSGYFLHPHKEQKRELFREIPLDRLLVETDAPAMPLPRELDRAPLPPSPDGQPVNHPANLVRTYEELAKLRQMALEELQKKVEQNFIRLFTP